MFSKSKPLFDPGRVVMTPGAITAIANNNALPSAYLVRHVTGDWGKLDAVDQAENRKSLKTGLRILSSYILPGKETIWIITDAVDTSEGADPRKRELTTILLPSEY